MVTTRTMAFLAARKTFGTVLVGLIALGLAAPDLRAQVIHSAHVDPAAAKVSVRGSSLDAVGGFTLGGTSVSPVNVTPSTLDILFDADVANIVQWPGNYRLAADDSAFVSVYFAAPVVVPGDPPPPPPPAGPDCPCIAGWEASGIPKDNFTFCYFDYYSQQQWIAGQRDQWFISAGFDPSNLFFDPADPGNSVSYCALHDGVEWTVAEPVVNQDQFDDCDHWLWVNVCL